MLATLSGGFAGWVKEGRPVEAGSMSDSGPRKIFITEDVPKSFSGDKEAYLRASEKEVGEANALKSAADVNGLVATGQTDDHSSQAAQSSRAVEDASSAAPSPSLWEVVGGADKGGIVVRKGKDTSSEQEPRRLVTGSLIEQRELVGDRLRYALHTGEGPSEGWVSIRLKAKELVVKTR
ncbi:unnamed protein product [Symbiodinium pilosum]|uniref:Rhodanese domain-containing protein n=1 Tax=Symbiodinium pilosum TaxID=2952 RepID=A0A812TGX5_SYMPI|nr:unnamed protein product [Symbiodinium pilosum]